MVLALKQIGPMQIPTNTSGTKDFPCKHEFGTKINQVDVVIKDFKLDQVGAAKPIDIVSVGARQVRTSTTNNKEVTFTVRVNLQNGGNYTGEVSALIIADVVAP